jgi:hypothetical protein
LAPQPWDAAPGDAIADGVILNWMPAAHVPRAIEAIAAGAARRAVADIDIACYIRVCVTDDRRRRGSGCAKGLTGYAIVEAYHAYFTACGFGANSTACRDAWQQGDRAGATRASRIPWCMLWPPSGC